LQIPAKILKALTISIINAWILLAVSRKIEDEVIQDFTGVGSSIEGISIRVTSFTPEYLE